MKIENSIVIHQPNFLPWLGYFAKLIYAQKLIVLDNVSFSKRKHIDRVQIINSEGELLWIGFPIGKNYKTPCNKIYFNNQKVLNNIIKTLYSSYSRAKYFKPNIEFIENILSNCLFISTTLSEIDIYIVQQLLFLLEIESPEIIRSSQFLESTFMEPTNRIIYLCEKTNSKNLIVGSKEATEVHQVNKLEKYGVNILLQDYYNNHPTYFQTRRTRLGFAKGLSIVDSIFNIGIEETKNLLLLKPVCYEK